MGPLRSYFPISIINFFVLSHYAIKTRLVKAIPLSFGHVVGKGVVLTVQGVEITIQGGHGPDRKVGCG